MAGQSRLRGSRLGRLGILGKLAGGIAGGVLGEGARRLAQGQPAALEDLLLTPANAERLAARLAEMRGAAMKLGQLLSMDSGALLPAQFGEVLARLRQDAHSMPLGEVAQVLKAAWGEDWESRFARFQFTPLAAASIGQVHRAVLREGAQLAIKLQYPGVRNSIDSDIDNVAALLRWGRLVPESVDLGPLLEDAKRQLHTEADYRAEAAAMTRYANLLGEDPRFILPRVYEPLSNADVLAMDYLDGDPIESLTEAPVENRNMAAAALIQLTLRELFDWGLVQTDPNFANYRIEKHSGRIQLLDFGAARGYPGLRREALRRLLSACLHGEDSDIRAAAIAVGYLAEQDAAPCQASVIQLLRTATEPLRTTTAYDFARCDLAARIRDNLIEMRLRLGFARMPPPEVLFLHRKIGGLYLLLRHLRIKLPVATLLESWV